MPGLFQWFIDSSPGFIIIYEPFHDRNMIPMYAAPGQRNDSYPSSGECHRVTTHLFTSGPIKNGLMPQVQWGKYFVQYHRSMRL